MKLCIAILLSLSLCSCMSVHDSGLPRHEVNESGDASLAALLLAMLPNSPLEGLFSAFDLAYDARAFRRINKRWPNDYEELGEFVHQTDGLLELGTYQQVGFTELPDCKLKIEFLREGGKRRMSLTLDDPNLGR